LGADAGVHAAGAFDIGQDLCPRVVLGIRCAPQSQKSAKKNRYLFHEVKDSDFSLIAYNHFSA
jgi:hypothetical protein